MSVLTWLGHSGFLVESRGTRLAFDVWRSGPTWSGTDLTGLDVLAISHGHFDHAEDAPQVLEETGATAACIFEVAKWLQSQGVPAERTVDLNKGGTWRHKGWELTLVPAEHSSGCPGPDGIVPGGEACGWIVRTPDGEALYHAGDTTVFGDMRLLSELYRPQVAMLPIGGHYTMGPREAAHAVRLLRVPHVVPMHYGTFLLLAGTPEELRRHVDGVAEVHPLEPGGRLDLEGLLHEGTPAMEETRNV